MADILRIKRRLVGGAGTAPPGGLYNAELAYNENDDILWYGKGLGAGGFAQNPVAIGGVGMASSATPVASASTGAAGTSGNWSRGDHRHPSDPLLAPLASPIFTGDPQAPTPLLTDNDRSIATTEYVKGQGYATTASVPLPSSATPLVDVGSGTPGTGTTYARNDHQHPVDTTRAPLDNPIFTGDPRLFASPANTDNDTSIATTAFVKGQRLDQLATPTADVSFGSRKIIGLADPQNSTDAATKNYVDLAIQGLTAHDAVRAASVGNLVSLAGLPTLDGVALGNGERVLVKDQSNPAQNGVYVVGAGSWVRAADFNDWVEFPSAFVFIQEGTVNADNGWLCTATQGGTINATPINWVQFSGAGQINAGNGLTKSGNTLNVVGTAGRISIGADNVDIDTNYVGQNSITTLGTIVGAATWNANTIAMTKGGTGVTSILAGYVTSDGNTLASVTQIPNTAIAGLKTMAFQDANNVAITGGTFAGTLSGVTWDLGTF